MSASTPGASRRRYWTPVARIRAWQLSSVPSASARKAYGSSRRTVRTSWGVRISAPSRVAWVTARRARSAPDSPAGKPRFLDPRRGARLPAGRLALHEQRPEPLGGAVDGGREAGRAAADDDEVVGRQGRTRPQAGHGRTSDGPRGGGPRTEGSSPRASRRGAPRGLGTVDPRAGPTAW